jgi:Tfp pilus assembly protein PilN
MSVKLNLASSPFRNRALPWTVTAVITVASIVALLFIAQATFRTNAKIGATQRDVARLRSENETLKQKAQAIETALTPDQKHDLKYAHGLVDRKRFSWARLFADLEGTLPGTIRITRIAVKEIQMQGDRPVADLELVVASKSPTHVTEMIQKMDSEGVFQAQLVSQNPKTGRGEVGAEYELSVRYVPRAGFTTEPSSSKGAVDTAGEGSKPR